jgi:hypothetical protein
MADDGLQDLKPKQKVPQVSMLHSAGGQDSSCAVLTSAAATYLQDMYTPIYADGKFFGNWRDNSVGCSRCNWEDVENSREGSAASASLTVQPWGQIQFSSSQVEFADRCAPVSCHHEYPALPAELPCVRAGTPSTPAHGILQHGLPCKPYGEGLLTAYLHGLAQATHPTNQRLGASTAHGGHAQCKLHQHQYAQLDRLYARLMLTTDMLLAYDMRGSAHPVAS